MPRLGILTWSGELSEKQKSVNQSFLIKFYNEISFSEWLQPPKEKRNFVKV